MLQWSAVVTCFVLFGSSPVYEVNVQHQLFYTCTSVSVKFLDVICSPFATFVLPTLKLDKQIQLILLQDIFNH